MGADEKWEAIVINEKDNVATALKPLREGARVRVEAGGMVHEVVVLSAIPLGHKFALRGIGKGKTVIKYGEPIGRSTAMIVAGEHVHVHNAASKPKGDLP